jgi:hypothetical protein
MGHFLSHSRDFAKVVEALKAPITEFDCLLMFFWRTKPMKLQCLRVTWMSSRQTSKNWKKTMATVMSMARIGTTRRVNCKMDVRHQVVMTSKSVPLSPDWSLIRVTTQTNDMIRVILGWQQWLTANEQDAIDAGTRLQEKKREGESDHGTRALQYKKSTIDLSRWIADDASRAGS